MPIDYNDYPENWPQIRADILDRAGNCCEGSPKYPDCRAANGQPHPITGSKVVLTVAHMDHDRTNNDPSNLKALCQRCHLTHDAGQHQQNAAETRRRKREKGQLSLLTTESNDL